MQTELVRTGVAVCVTNQRDCDRLIKAGRDLADKLGCDLAVMSALPRLYDGETAKVLEYLYSCSAQAGAEMLVMYTDKPMEALLNALSKRGVAHVILGQPKRKSTQMGTRLMCGYPQATYYMLDRASQAYPVRGAIRSTLLRA